MKKRWLAAALGFALLWQQCGSLALASEMTEPVAIQQELKEEAEENEAQQEDIQEEGDKDAFANGEALEERASDDSQNLTTDAIKEDEEASIEAIEVPKTDFESESADDTELQIDKNEMEEDCVSLAPQSTGSLGYSDMPETSGWRYEAVAYVKEKGIMNGISGTSRFAPDEPLTRAMFAAIIYRMEGSPAASYAAKFPDVPDGNYFSVPIVWANQAGMINGHSNTGLFGTFENITREDMVTIMYRYAKYKNLDLSGAGSLGVFSDQDQISGYAREALAWAVGNGIINGRSGTGLVDPRGNASRVECAAIIQRFMKKYMSTSVSSGDAGKPSGGTGAGNSSGGNSPSGSSGPQEGIQTYVYSVNSTKFHHPNCPSVKRMNASNRRTVTATRQEMLARGFSPCSNCNP